VLLCVSFSFFFIPSLRNDQFCFEWDVKPQRDQSVRHWAMDYSAPCCCFNLAWDALWPSDWKQHEQGNSALPIMHCRLGNRNKICPRKCQFVRKKCVICAHCWNMRNMRQSHIRIKLTCLVIMVSDTTQPVQRSRGVSLHTTTLLAVPLSMDMYACVVSICRACTSRRRCLTVNGASTMTADCCAAFTTTALATGTLSRWTTTFSSTTRSD